MTMLNADRATPYDRPNLSKEYLAGTAQAEWIPFRSPTFYKDHHIDVRCDSRVVRLDSAHRALTLSDGSRITYGACLLATGAKPNRLTVPAPPCRTYACFARSRTATI